MRSCCSLWIGSVEVNNVQGSGFLCIPLLSSRLLQRISTSPLLMAHARIISNNLQFPNFFILTDDAFRCSQFPTLFGRIKGLWAWITHLTGTKDSTTGSPRGTAHSPGIFLFAFNSVSFPLLRDGLWAPGNLMPPSCHSPLSLGFPLAGLPWGKAGTFTFL